jgi:DNA-binding NarL/FixJ family response regulator
MRIVSDNFHESYPMTDKTIAHMPVNSPTTEESTNVQTLSGESCLKVLIVDDSSVLREKLIEMLSQVSGLKVVGEAEGVADAQRSIQLLEPGLVVLDLQLRDGSGLEVLRETKRNHPHIKLVVFTNQPELQYRQRCADLGADYFLCKSTDAKALVAIGEILVSERS